MSPEWEKKKEEVREALEASETEEEFGVKLTVYMMDAGFPNSAVHRAAKEARENMEKARG